MGSSTTVDCSNVGLDPDQLNTRDTMVTEHTLHFVLDIRSILKIRLHAKDDQSLKRTIERKGKQQV